MVVAVKNGLARRVKLVQIEIAEPVDPQPGEVFAPKSLYGFGYQPRLQLREKPAVYLRDGRGNTLCIY